MKVQSRFALAVLCMGFVAGCAGVHVGAPQTASVQITSGSTAVRAGETQQFAATVSGANNTAVSWSVNGVVGGHAAVGSIDNTGIYKAPATIPQDNVVEVSAALLDGSAIARASTILLNPIPVIESVSEQAANAGVLNISGHSFVQGATVRVDDATVSTTFISSQLITASAAISAAKQSVEISVANPDPGAANSGLFTFVGRPTRPSRTSFSNGAARFLDQASFGPTAAEIALVQSMGMSAYIDDQMNVNTHPQSSWTIPATVPTNPNNGNNLCQPGNLVTCFQILWFQNALMGPDQLRQRTAFALSQIWVVSGNTVQFGDSYSTYYRILNTDAFANYQTIINDVTTTSAMGYYLDMGNSAKPANGQIANENYARELMQLFTVGLYKLNDDGTYILDGNGQPQPAYSENDIQQIAKALTGWTYQATVTQQFPQNYLSATGTNRSVPMIVYTTVNQHDTSAKVCDVLGCNIQPGQTAQQDLTSVIQTVFNHPNVPAFVSKQMIEHLVTSNPSPAYVARISAVFKDNGSHVRGDMGAVVKAILLDPEARQDDQYASNDNSGHLREPVLYLTSIARGLANSINPANATTYTAPSGSMTNLGATLVSTASNMGQNVLFAPSVFNYFPPDNIIPGTNTVGPEFLVFTTATWPQRANFVDSVIRNAVGTGIDFGTTITNYAGTPAAPIAPDVIVNRLDQAFTYGQMSATTKAAIVSAISTMPSATQTDLNYRAKRAIYLVLTSSQYQVVH